MLNLDREHSGVFTHKSLFIAFDESPTSFFLESLDQLVQQ